jgi:hypothetical protein
MAILRHISLNLLKSEKKHKVGIKINRQMAGWENDYLLFKYYKYFNAIALADSLVKVV